MVEQPAVKGRCAWPRCGKGLTGRQRRFCSPRCKVKFFVSKRRRDLKKRAVEYKGGKCYLCGYDRCLDALSFHHRDEQKDFGIGAKGYTRSWDSVRKELDRCLLMCANCHAEVHAHRKQ